MVYLQYGLRAIWHYGVVVRSGDETRGEALMNSADSTMWFMWTQPIQQPHVISMIHMNFETRPPCFSSFFLFSSYVHWNSSCICRFYNGLISEATYNNILSVCDFTHLGPFLGKQHISYVLVQAIFFSMVNLLWKHKYIFQPIVHIPSMNCMPWPVMRDLSMVSSTEDNSFGYSNAMWPVYRQ